MRSPGDVLSGLVLTIVGAMIVVSGLDTDNIGIGQALIGAGVLLAVLSSLPPAEEKRLDAHRQER